MFGGQYRKIKYFFSTNKKNKIDKDGNDKIVDISYKIKLIDSFRFRCQAHHQVLLII